MHSSLATDTNTVVVVFLLRGVFAELWEGLVLSCPVWPCLGKREDCDWMTGATLPWLGRMNR